MNSKDLQAKRVALMDKLSLARTQARGKAEGFYSLSEDEIRKLVDEAIEVLDFVDVEIKHAQFMDAVKLPKEKVYALFDSGMFNAIACGYGKVALRNAQLQYEKNHTLFEQKMKEAYSFLDAREAERAYYAD